MKNKIQGGISEGGISEEMCFVVGGLALHVSITDRSRQGWMGVKWEYRGGRRDPCNVDLGCTPSSTLKGSCPILRHNPESQACSVSPWTALYYLIRAALFADPRNGH